MEAWYAADQAAGGRDYDDPVWQAAFGEYMDANCGGGGGGGGGGGWWYCQNADPYGSGFGGTDCVPI
jgi:hypothetical protein